MPHHKFTCDDARGGPVVTTKYAIRSITPRIRKNEPIGIRRSSMNFYQNQMFNRMQKMPAITASRTGRWYQGRVSLGGITV